MGVWSWFCQHRPSFPRLVGAESCSGAAFACFLYPAPHKRPVAHVAGSVKALKVHTALQTVQCPSCQPCGRQSAAEERPPPETRHLHALLWELSRRSAWRGREGPSTLGLGGARACATSARTIVPPLRPSPPLGSFHGAHAPVHLRQLCCPCPPRCAAPVGCCPRCRPQEGGGALPPGAGAAAGWCSLPARSWRSARSRKPPLSARQRNPAALFAVLTKPQPKETDPLSAILNWFDGYMWSKDARVSGVGYEVRGRRKPAALQADSGAERAQVGQAVAEHQAAADEEEVERGALSLGGGHTRGAAGRARLVVFRELTPPWSLFTRLGRWTPGNAGASLLSDTPASCSPLAAT